MDKNQPHGTASPSPKTELATRLEHVRAETGHENSLRAFWRELCDGWQEDEAVSYEAARRYHWNREAPVHYLVRVSEVFGYRLEWLATGDGAPTQAEKMYNRYGHESQDPASQLLQAVRHRYGSFGEGALGMSEPQQRQFLQLLVRYVQTAPDSEELLQFESWNDLPEELLKLADDLHFLVWLPVEVGSWGFESRVGQRKHQLNDYVTAMLHALSVLVQESGGGLPVDRAERSLIRIARNVVDREKNKRNKRHEEIAENLDLKEIPSELGQDLLELGEEVKQQLAEEGRWEQEERWPPQFWEELERRWNDEHPDLHREKRALQDWYSELVDRLEEA